MQQGSDRLFAAFRSVTKRSAEQSTLANSFVEFGEPSPAQPSLRPQPCQRSKTAISICQMVAASRCPQPDPLSTHARSRRGPSGSGGHGAIIPAIHCASRLPGSGKGGAETKAGCSCARQYIAPRTGSTCTGLRRVACGGHRMVLACMTLRRRDAADAVVALLDVVPVDETCPQHAPRAGRRSPWPGAPAGTLRCETTPRHRRCHRTHVDAGTTA